MSADETTEIRERLARIEAKLQNGLITRVATLDSRLWALVILVSLQLLGTAALGLLLGGG